jgi:murein DD-endopeptidase MepM/ murein hydrolase activator NlpD
VKTNGDTAYQEVYAPVDGIIRWTERSSGGIAIDMGNGYAVAIFHITVDRSLSDGDPLTQGQYIGYISGPGGEGNMGFDHLHFTLWATDDGGNWSRESIPFTGQNAIAGVEYPERGAYSQYYGTLFYP